MKDNKCQQSEPKVAAQKLSAKQQRDERLKKSLRANLQRRKAKMRAIKAADGESPAQ